MPHARSDNLRKRKPPKIVELSGDNEHTSAEATSGNPSTTTSPPPLKSTSTTQRCLSVTKYMLLFLIIPPFINFAALNMESQQLHPPGVMYDVGHGQKLYFHCEGTGSPAVLLDAPTGFSSDVWSLVVSEVSKHTRVCVYDRAGLGFSERPPYSNSSEEEEGGKPYNRWQEFTVERMADDLHRLITYSSQQVDKPFIYVGSQLGTLVARFYTQLYDGEVSDLILIDPLVESLFEQDEEVWKQFWYGQLLPSAQGQQLSAATGITRLALMMGLTHTPLDRSTESLPANVTSRQKHLLCNPRHLSSVVDEHFFMTDTFSQMKTVLQLKPFPSNVSVTVITGNYYDDLLPSLLNKAWAKATQQLISRLPSGSSNHIVVNGADRHMLYSDPRAVTEPVLRAVRKRRQQQKSGTKDR